MCGDAYSVITHTNTFSNSMKLKHTTKKSANRSFNKNLSVPSNWFRSYAMHQEKIRLQIEEEKKKNKDKTLVQKTVNRVAKFLGIQKRKV